MTSYRNEKDYRSDLPYKGNWGIYQTAPMRQVVAIRTATGAASEALVATPWGGAEKTDKSELLKWHDAQKESTESLLPWGKPAELSAQTKITHQKAALRALQLDTEWADPSELGVQNTLSWQKSTELTPIETLSPWSETHRADSAHRTEFLTISYRHESDFYRNPQDYRNWQKYPLPTYPLALSSSSILPWGGNLPKLNDNCLPWGDGFHIWGIDKPLEWTDDPRPMPNQPEPVEPDIKEFHNVATDLTVRDVATNTPLSMQDIEISLDIDSFAWTLTATVLNSASMTLAAPSKLIEVTTMGWSWVFLVESYGTERRIGKLWKIRASSQSRTLDAPWQSAGSHINQEPTTWKQAVAEVMPSGWQVEFYSIDDYDIPAGSWSYIDKTPKGALSELLEALGAVAIPDRYEKLLRVQPRYKYAAWEYNEPNINPDAIIHESMIFSESGQFHPAPTCNGAWVSGNNRHGVIVEAIRTGTDGQPFAADTYHDLITDQDAGRQKAKQLIAATGSKTLVTLETLITDEQASPGLITPGQIVEIQISEENWRGICLSTNISGAGLPAITQTLTIERDNDDHN